MRYPYKILSVTLGSLLWLSSSVHLSYADSQCENGSCIVPPDCEAEGLSRKECRKYKKSRARGREQDKNGFIERGKLSFINKTLPQNSERLLPDEKFTLWVLDETQLAPELDAEVVYQTRIIEDSKTIKLNNQVRPIRFASGRGDIPTDYVERLRNVLDNMRDRNNVRLNFIGHTDNEQLSPSTRAKYGNNDNLSAERAQIVAEFFQRELGLPPESVSFEGRGEREPIASNDTEAGMARNRRVEVEVWYDEIIEREVQEPVVEQPELSQIQVCRVMERCIYRRVVGNYKKIQLLNAVAPIRYEGTQVDIAESHIRELRQALKDVEKMSNVVVRVVGHTDNQPLRGAVQRIYKNRIVLSKAMADRIARIIQNRLNLSNSQIQVIGKGEKAPIESNTTASGRALNRRVDIEIWHDDPRDQAISLPKACPGGTQAEMLATEFLDDKPLVPFKTGQPAYPNGFLARVERIWSELEDRTNLRIKFVGHTTNQRLSRRAAMVYGDHQGLSEARAQRVMRYVKRELNLENHQVLFEGRGFVEPVNPIDESPFAEKKISFFDVENEGTYDPADARVELIFVYDELAQVEQDPNIEITRVMQHEPPVSPFSLHPIRITVDGETLDDTRRHTADIQRCTDVALDGADIQLRYDNLRQNQRLNVQAVPAAITFWDDPETEVMENRVAFKAYANYETFINRAEVRLYEAEQSLQTEPLDIVPLNEDFYGEWWSAPEVLAFEGPVKELVYVVRVYDEEGRYDQTAAKRLWVANTFKSPEFLEKMDAIAEQNVSYGENHLVQRGIPVSGGAIVVDGKKIPEGYSVWVMNHPAPVSEDGEFVIEQVIPDGLHSVEVAVLDSAGNGKLYLRDLELKRKDWFVVGIADITFGEDDTNGPAELVTGDTTHYDSDTWADGRLAFYAKGKTKKDIIITASADSREEPLEDLFSNFDEKDPDSVFRRLDPDYFYPTYGDDSTTIEDAPTSGKFYLRAEKNNSYALWGNFETQLYDTDLAQIDRVFYGATGHYESLAVTEYGESRTEIDVFAAEPGTLLAREEFRGTGGSLYFLQRRDITQGSDRLRIEIRDKDSGIVLEARNLIYAQDYDIDYIQGRILLNEPLASTSDDGLLVQDGSLSGNPVYLVARYEYTPGFDEIEDVSTGGRFARWFGNTVKLGATVSSQEQLGEIQDLAGVDITIRKTPSTYVKLESSNTEGPAFGQTFSNDGGFQFNTIGLTTPTDTKAAAHRIEAAAELSDLFGNTPGKVTLYTQDREAGFAAPGQITNTDVTQTGASLDMPIGERWNVYAKLDERDQDEGLSNSAVEVDARVRVGERWRLSSGLRVDERKDDSVVVPTTQTLGERTDLAFEAAYDSLAAWSLYGYVQGTLDVDEGRDENDRAGIGGAFKLSDRFTLDAEVSDGDGGNGGTLGVDYLVTDRTNLYMAYNLQNERSDTGVRARNGRATVGFRSRYTDSISVYGEERLLFGDQPSGLTHAYGVDIAPNDRWNFGSSIEVGTLEDDFTGIETERTAVGFDVGYAGDRLNYVTAIELREDVTDTSERNTYLFRNAFSLQLTPNWRNIVKLNIAESESSQGEFFDGDFTEFVWGYAYRPIYNDRLNLLFKYTFFENLPAPEQESVDGTRAEFIQRSNIVAIDINYDISKRWTLGTKLARRLGEVSLDRVDPQFFESNANLAVLRADWHIVRKWDLLVEARALEVEEAQDTRSGFLLAGYRHLGKNIKLGLGYNFTDFSDDLTDLDFDSEGVFINIVGKL